MKQARFTTHKLNILGITIIVRCENDDVPDRDLATIANELLKNYAWYEINGPKIKAPEKKDMGFIE